MTRHYIKPLLFIFLISCSKLEVVDVYQDSSVKLECELSNGLKNGKCIAYYKNGSKEYISNYKNDTLNGPSQFFHPNGELNWEVEFHNGNKNGEIKYYDSLGKVFQTSSFKNNKLHGISMTYYPDGKLSTKMNYTEGLLSGQYESYYSNGNIKTIAEYLSDERIDFKTYDSLGQVIDHLIKYEISHKLSQNTITLNINITNKVFDIAGLQVFKSEPDSSFSIADKVYSPNYSFEYRLPLTGSDFDFKGVLFEIDTLNDGKGIVKSKRNIEYTLSLDQGV